MKTIQVYQELKQKVSFFYQKLKLFKYEKIKGRKLAISIVDTITLALYRQASSRATKKSLWNDFRKTLKCSYKTLVVNINKCSILCLQILKCIFLSNRQNSHIIKHTDSTDIPVCLNKNAKYHKTMKIVSSWGHSGKGLFYGLKLHLTSDLKRRILSISFASGNVGDRSQFLKLNKDLEGIFIADAGYVSEDLEKEFYIEHKRILFTKPRKNMKKVITFFQKKLYDTRMTIELNFRNLKMLYNLVSSFPRTINGYLANYIHSIVAYALR
ncbi:MAG: Transposase, IS4 family [Candidatus Jorgensenbacteria bacterium GW2011_GWA2_45_13]|uniref:Transposase, IS4 family n=1 Tax=Candidatus Jorgensenbacteria bacterium GW2011_GWA2_45_13 TaxID=1618662 RepID=A0A0G1L593_9BACT|nr:MAG: Transposase, IS4 family [Candidatus Jorgensenbacteria bacterium GW2011_GWA2_45_13]